MSADRNTPPNLDDCDDLDTLHDEWMKDPAYAAAYAKAERRAFLRSIIVGWSFGTWLVGIVLLVAGSRPFADSLTLFCLGGASAVVGGCIWVASR